jgi:hypothetical protein
MQPLLIFSQDDFTSLAALTTGITIYEQSALKYLSPMHQNIGPDENGKLYIINILLQAVLEEI